MSEREQALARVLGIDDETTKAMREEWAALDIEWHCSGRHGVVRNVPGDKAGRVQRVIEWHMGSGACWWNGTPKAATRSVEFVAMTKVFPAPKKPWGWCGTTVLYPDWQKQEADAESACAEFKAGDPVWFEFKGARKRGLVMWPNWKTVAVMVEGEGKYTVPPSGLTKEV